MFTLSELGINFGVAFSLRGLPKGTTILDAVISAAERYKEKFNSVATVAYVSCEDLPGPCSTLTEPPISVEPSEYVDKGYGIVGEGDQA